MSDFDNYKAGDEFWIRATDNTLTRLLKLVPVALKEVEFTGGMTDTCNAVELSSGLVVLVGENEETYKVRTCLISEVEDGDFFYCESKKAMHRALNLVLPEVRKRAILDCASGDADFIEEATLVREVIGYANRN